MRYTRVLGRIIKAAENLKIDGAPQQYPEAVATQIFMWKSMLESQYNEREILQIQTILANYLEVI